MKIKNRICIFLAALAIVSCSKDDGNENIPQEPVDAVVSIATKAIGPTTKADGNVVGQKEERIESLSAYIFKADGRLAGYKRDAVAANEQSISEIKDILIKIVPDRTGSSSEQFTLILLANTNELKVNTLDDLKSATELGGDPAGYKVGTSVLPMVSAELTFTGVKKSGKDAHGNYTTNNWVLETGGNVVESETNATEIPLTRMMARIEVNQVIVNLSDKEYEGSTFALQTIALMNVRTGVDISLKGIGDFVKGYESDGYNYLPLKENGWWIPATDQSEEYKTTLVPMLSQSYDFGDGVYENTSTNGYKFGDPIANPSVVNPLFYRYIFPNSSISGGAAYETGLVVGGIFTYQSGKTALKHFIVKLNNPQEAVKGNQVLANTVYKVNILIQGEGSEDENHPQVTAGITATISVKDWVVIEQEEILPVKPE